MKVFFKMLLLLVITNTYANVNTQNLSTLNFDNLEFTLSKNELQKLSSTKDATQTSLDEKSVNTDKTPNDSKGNINTEKTTETKTVIKYLPVYIPVQIPVYKPIYVPKYIPVNY